MHLARVARGEHRGGHCVGGGIHDHAHGNEGHSMERGNLRDHRTFHVDRRGTGAPKGGLFGGRGADRLRTGEKSAADDPPLCTDGCGQGVAPVPRGGEGRPIRGNDLTRQADISRSKRGIEGAGHTPTDQRRGSGLDQRVRRRRRRRSHAAHRDERAVIEH